MELIEACSYFKQLSELESIELNTVDGNIIKCKFLIENFKHLCGLQKLKDLDFLQKMRHKQMFEYCSNLKNQEEVKNSDFYSLEVRDRIYYFNRILWVIMKGDMFKTPKTFYTNKHSKSKSSIKSDYYFKYIINEKSSNTIDSIYLVLHFVTYDGSYYVPSSFYITKSGTPYPCGSKVSLSSFHTKYV